MSEQLYLPNQGKLDNLSKLMRRGTNQIIFSTSRGAVENRFSKVNFFCFCLIQNHHIFAEMGSK